MWGAFAVVTMPYEIRKCSGLRRGGFMPVLPINEVPIGAILARPVEDSMGRILINAGEALTEQLLNVLKKRGFVEVETRPESQRRDTEMLEKRLTSNHSENMQYDADIQKIRQEVDERFHGMADDDRSMQIIRLVVQKVLMERVARAKGLM